MEKPLGIVRELDIFVAGEATPFVVVVVAVEAGAPATPLRRASDAERPTRPATTRWTRSARLGPLETVAGSTGVRLRETRLESPSASSTLATSPLRAGEAWSVWESGDSKRVEPSRRM